MKNKVFFNPLIRYALLVSPKMNISTITAFKFYKAEDMGIGSKVSSVLIFLVINIVPCILTFVYSKNVQSLQDKDKKNKFGTAYQERTADKKAMYRVVLFPLLFFYRRTAFALTSVLLFDRPAIQMIVHIFLTMATLVYLCYDSWMFESKIQRSIEIANEVFLLLLSILLL